MADMKELLIQYKQLLSNAAEEGIKLSDAEAMEELNIDLDTLEDIQSMLENEEPTQSGYRDTTNKRVVEDDDISMDERPYIQEEEEEPVLEEEVSDEYYEDMNDNQWEEIEAAVEEEEERERAAQIKKEREAKAQKKKEAESRKKREEELRKAAEQANKTSSESTAHETTTNTTPPVVTTETVDPVEVVDGNFKTQGYYDNIEPDEDYKTRYEEGQEKEALKREEEARKAQEVKSSHTPIQEPAPIPGQQAPSKAPVDNDIHVVPVSPASPLEETSTGTKKEQFSKHEENPSVPPVSAAPVSTTPNVGADPVVNTDPVPVASDFDDIVKNAFGDNYVEPTNAHSPAQTISNQSEPVSHQEPHSTNNNVPKEDVIVTPKDVAVQGKHDVVQPVTPHVDSVHNAPLDEGQPTPIQNINPVPPVVGVPTETVMAPLSAVESEQTTAPQYNHNQTYADIEAAEYSRAHRMEQDAQAAVEKAAQSGATHFQKENIAPKAVPNVSVEGVVEQETPSIEGVNHKTPIQHENSFYTYEGVPVSVEAQVPRVEAAFVRSETIEPAITIPDLQKSRLQETFNIVYATYDQDVADIKTQIEGYKRQLEDLKAKNGPADVIESLSEDIDYSVGRLQTMQMEKARVVEAIENNTISVEAISYLPIARVMLEDYDRETVEVTKQLHEYKQQMTLLEQEGGSVVEKASVKAEIDACNDRLENIRFERKEIVDTMYTTEPAKSIVGAASVSAAVSIYDKDISGITKQIQESKALLTQLKESGAPASEIASVRADIDFNSGRLRDIKSESQRVAAAVKDGTLTMESVSYIPVAKTLIDEYDKETWTITKQLSDAKSKLAEMKELNIPLIDRMDIEKEIDSYVVRLQDIRADRKLVTDALYEGTSPLKDVVYVSAAKKQLAVYERETMDITKQLVVSKQALQELKAKPGVDIKTIKAKENEVLQLQEKLKIISADRQRVVDFINHGPRRISRDDVAGSEYSRDHKNQVRQANKGDLPTTPDSKIYHSRADMKKVHKTRMESLLQNYGSRFAGAIKKFTTSVIDEDEDMERVDRAKDTTVEVASITDAFLSNTGVSKELKRLGLDKKAILRDIEDIGVIAGIGDVSQMSIKELKEALVKDGGKLSLPALRERLRVQGSSLPYEKQKKLLDAIELKEKLKLNNNQIANLATKHAGEYINYSKSQLKKMLKDGKLSIDEIPKVEIALQYKKLAKLNVKAMDRWKLTFSFVSGAAKTLAHNNEYLSDIMSMSGHAKTAYRISKTTLRVGTKVGNAGIDAGKKAIDAGKKAASQASNYLRTRSKEELVKKAGIKTGTKTIGKMQGLRTGNLVSASGSTASNVAKGTLKGGAAITKRLADFGTKVAAGAKAIAGVVAKGISAIVAAIGAPVLIVILLLILAAVVVSLVFTTVMGDENNGTSVPEMVEYLNEKNAAWLEEIEDKVNGRPATTGRGGATANEYTRVNFTYLDENGNICVVTDNTKELISMAAVYFKQDFSNEDDVYEYLDKMWEASHEVKYTESEMYGCDGSVCLDDLGNLATDEQGYNGKTRTYDCTTDITAIRYNDCYEITTEADKRYDTHEASFRFYEYEIYSDPLAGTKYTRYQSMPAIYTYGSTGGLSTKGYGCLTTNGTYYCDDLDYITNTEIIKKMIDDVGVSYLTLINRGGCEIKHPGEYEGEPHYYCYSYDVSYNQYSLYYGDALDTRYDYVFSWDSSEGAYVGEDARGHKYMFYGYGEGTNGKYLNIDDIYVSYSSSQDVFVYYIPYYTCDEWRCTSGHRITSHYCDGNHEEKVCGGHVDLDVNITVISFDEIFELEVNDLPYYDDGTHSGTVDTSQICTHSDITAHPTVVGGWICNNCNVVYTPLNGYDYSNATIRPGTSDSINYNAWVPDDIEWCKTIYEQDWKELYGVQVFSSLYANSDGIVTSGMPTHANALPIPIYNQLDYPDSPYGLYGSVASHGCGITCVSMLATYYKDKEFAPPYLARLYGSFNTEDGSMWTLFSATAEDLGLPLIYSGGTYGETYNWTAVVNALQEGKAVISVQNSNGIFTSSGHFILLVGITDGGKILVNDPNGANYYKNSTMVNGFANGFSHAQIQSGGSAYWIYDIKPEE